MKTISFEEFVETVDKGIEIPDSTLIEMDANKFDFDGSKSVYNHVYYRHIKTDRYIYVIYHDDFENWASFYLVMPDGKHAFIADDEEDNICYTKMDNSNKFVLEYNLQLT